MIKFYDTSSLLIARERVFEDYFVISSITFKELERIKTATNKDPEVKYAARMMIRLLEQHQGSYCIVIHKTIFEDKIRSLNLDVTDDTRILVDAYYYEYTMAPDNMLFYTNDLALKNIANLLFGEDSIKSITAETDGYTGYKEIYVDDESLANFYENQGYNHYDLMIGEYLIIRNDNNEVVDLRVWTGEGHRFLNYDTFNSRWFGKTSPYKNDPYQKILFDSLCNNTLTIIRGPAGVGKSYIALAYLMQELQRGSVDNIIIMCNTVATKDAAKLG